ncbi:MAG: hypothetical protein EOO22_20405, partial [Comamonadaceae bacterium]
KVVVLSGRDAGKSGVVKSVQRRYNRVLVEGLNLVRSAPGCDCPCVRTPDRACG